MARGLGPCSPQRSNAGRIVRAPDMVQRNAVLPSGTFEIRLCREVVHVAETEVGYWDDVPRDVQHFLQRFLVENAHPADTNPFRASREPEVLDGADCGIEGQFPASSGGPADVHVHSLDCRRCKGSVAPPECLRALGWRISSRGLPRRYRGRPDSIAERCHGRLCGSPSLE